MDISGNEKVYYSVCSGYNYYVKAAGGFTPVWVRVSEDKDKVVHDVVTHVKSEESYYLTNVPAENSEHINIDEWISIIRNPPKSDSFIWPVDFISYEDREKKSDAYSLVFQMRSNTTVKINNLIDFIDSDDYKNLPDEKKNELIMNFLDACISFYSLGYAYHEFNRNRIFVKIDSLKVFFEFSFSIHLATDLHEKREFNSIGFLPEYNDLSYYYQNHYGASADIKQPMTSCLDLASDYFCIAVILFKMIVGVLPYEGKHVSHLARNYAHEIEEWQQQYINYPIFIFDSNDDTNRLSIATYTDVYEQRWNDLPSNIKNMFHNVFQKPNALRTTNQLFFYSPEQWKAALSGTGDSVPLVYRT